MTTFDKARLQRYGIGILRVVLGIIFAAHGAQKLFQFGLSGTAGAFGQMGIPLPTLSAAVVMAAELFGGLALVFGLFTRLAAVPLAVTMLVAMLAVHRPGGFFLPEGVEYTLALLSANVALVLTGPGAWALDNVLRGSGSATLGRASERAEAERGGLRPAA
ncbi:MAG TPA: DoxX family protein [Longimicrobiales bacterium]|nr:DoxX family protein [Longimicrobiales bacterium]